MKQRELILLFLPNIWQKTLFLPTLKDLEKDLPEVETIYVPLKQDDDVGKLH